MKFQVMCELPSKGFSRKKVFKTKEVALDYANKFSKKHKSWKVTVQQIGHVPSKESMYYNKAQSDYMKLCNLDPSFKDKISFDDFRQGKLKELVDNE